ncbi:hypothetical protein GCM10010289_01710 [Streptomyces violascens]|nr:hypothetical protein GCM10010289_01710 [Streptomyces violascens]
MWRGAAHHDVERDAAGSTAANNFFPGRVSKLPVGGVAAADAERPGSCRLVTGLILFVGLTWFQVFAKEQPLYMAASAFSAYGILWFAIGWNRYRFNDPRTDAGMCVAFMVISAMGATMFFKVADRPAGLLFLGLFAICFSDLFASIGLRVGEAYWASSYIATGGRLIYLAYATTVNFALAYHCPV